MKGIWVKLIKNHRIMKQDTEECAYADAKEALRDVLRRLDEPYPLWLPKHEHEFEEFRCTRFTRDHFMEQTDFDRLEMEYIDGDVKRQSKDPRNAF